MSAVYHSRGRLSLNSMMSVSRLISPRYVLVGDDQFALSFTPIYRYGLSLSPREFVYKYTAYFLLAIALTTLLYVAAGD